MATKNATELPLKIEKKNREDGKIQLTITVPAATVNDLMKNAAYILARQNRIDLSNLKVEEYKTAVVESVGEAQYDAFLHHFAMNAIVPHAITEKNIEPILEPDLNSSMEVVQDQDFTFVAVVTPKPHYELSSYDPVVIKIPKVSISESEIDAQIANMAERSSQTVADEGAEVVGNSEVVFGIKTVMKETNEPLEHMTAERRVYQLGEEYLPREFDEQIMGMKSGESRTFDFELPGPPNMDGSPGESRTVTTTIDLVQVSRKIIPSITNAWVEVHIPEAKNVDGLREMLRQQGMAYKAKEQESMKMFLSASALAERFVGTIPDEMYEYTRSDMLGNLNEQLKQNGMTMEQYAQSMGMEQQQFNMHLMLQVRETLRQSFALDALARHLKLTLTEEDITDTLNRMAPGNEEQARRELEGSGRSYILREAAMRTKANKWLVETATFEEFEIPEDPSQN